ncbi:MAG: HTTM domain-containing protein [Myxococcales bacterium]|nr:HTTM domain-containing protein [Myxococcales bacterium]
MNAALLTLTPAELVSSIAPAIYGFFAAPQPTLGLALSRAALGLVLAVDGLRMLREHDLWYAEDGLRRRLEPAQRLPPALDLFAWAAQLGLSSRAVLWALVGSALAFALGLATPLAGALLLLALLAIPPRNLFVVYGGDAFARVVLVLLLLSPCAASLSVDALLRGDGLGLAELRAPWAGRLILLEVSLLYLYNVLCKLPSASWRRGAVMFDLLRNRDFARGDVPRWLKSQSVSRVLTWGALLGELSFAGGILTPQVAALCCLAAIGFHLMIARLLDVHLFSYVMAAALLACLPREFLLNVQLSAQLSAQLSEPSARALWAEAGPAQLAGLALCLAYLVYAVLWDPPWRSRVSPLLHRALGPALARLHWVRSWRLFTNSCPQQLDIEFTIVDERGALRRWQWNRADQLAPAALRDEGRPDVPGHRFQRFKFALVDREDARARLVERVRQALRESGVRPRALAIDALFVDVHGARPIVGGRSLHSQLAARPGGGLDFEACAQLACAVRCPPSRVRLVELLLLAGLDAAVRGRPRVGLEPALALVLRLPHPVPLAPTTVAGLSRLCERVRDAEERARLRVALSAIARAPGDAAALSAR